MFCKWSEILKTQASARGDIYAILCELTMGNIYVEPRPPFDPEAQVVAFVEDNPEPRSSVATRLPNLV